MNQSRTQTELSAMESSIVGENGYDLIKNALVRLVRGNTGSKTLQGFIYNKERVVYTEWTRKTEEQIVKYLRFAQSCSERTTKDLCEPRGENPNIAKKLGLRGVQCGWRAHWFGGDGTCLPQEKQWDLAAEFLRKPFEYTKSYVLPYNAFISDILLVLTKGQIDLSRLLSTTERADHAALQFYMVYHVLQAVKKRGLGLFDKGPYVLELMRTNPYLLQTIVDTFIHNELPFTRRIQLIQNLFKLKAPTSAANGSTHPLPTSTKSVREGSAFPFLALIPLVWSIPLAAADVHVVQTQGSQLPINTHTNSIAIREEHRVHAHINDVLAGQMQPFNAYFGRPFMNEETEKSIEQATSTNLAFPDAEALLKRVELMNTYIESISERLEYYMNAIFPQSLSEQAFLKTFRKFSIDRLQTLGHVATVISYQILEHSIPTRDAYPKLLERIQRQLTVSRDQLTKSDLFYLTDDALAFQRWMDIYTSPENYHRFTGEKALHYLMSSIINALTGEIDYIHGLQQYAAAENAAEYEQRLFERQIAYAYVICIDYTIAQINKAYQNNSKASASEIQQAVRKNILKASTLFEQLQKNAYFPENKFRALVQIQEHYQDVVFNKLSEDFYAQTTFELKELTRFNQENEKTLLVYQTEKNAHEKVLAAATKAKQYEGLTLSGSVITDSVTIMAAATGLTIFATIWLSFKRPTVAAASQVEQPVAQQQLHRIPTVINNGGDVQSPSSFPWAVGDCCYYERPTNDLETYVLIIENVDTNLITVRTISKANGFSVNNSGPFPITKQEFLRGDPQRIQRDPIAIKTQYKRAKEETETTRKSFVRASRTSTSTNWSTS